MQYLSAKEVNQKLNIPQNKFPMLCTEDGIPKSEFFGNICLVPSKSPSPFVKWAGGKGQLLFEINRLFPNDMENQINKYAEPFVGGGAVLFDVLSKYNLEQIYISDINSELINTYIIIRDDVLSLIEILSKMQLEYASLVNEKKKEYYYAKRALFNDLKICSDKTVNVGKAALFIFLNKTCFNGLYRVNRKGLFNVPMGAYKNPKICDDVNLLKVSEALQKVTIVCGDYKESFNFIDDHTLAYFDPPYRPLTGTSSFTAYTENSFNDKSQIELSEFISALDKKGAKIIVSNSDPKNSNTEDNFFDVLYDKYIVKRVEATRMINCNSESRGKISELIINNY